MNELTYREFVPSDFEEVMALDLRPIEVREGRASTGEEPLELLALSLARSCYLWVATINEKICGFFGLAVYTEEGVTYGTPWFLSNDLPFAVHSNRGLFLKSSKRIVLFMKSKVDVLMNIVSLENVHSVRWLRWLGFQIDDKPFTFDRDPELHFVWFSMR
jgi:hypothetical protein